MAHIHRAAINVGISHYIPCLAFPDVFFFALVFISDESKFTLPLGLYRLSINAEYSSQWTQMFAGLVLAMIPVLIVFGVAQERLTRGLTLGALKGLSEEGTVPAAKVAEAIKKYAIKADKINPLYA